MNRMTSNLQRYLGGSPVAVLAKLIALSLIVGAIMAGLGLTPRAILRQAVEAAYAIYGLGFEALSGVAGYILTGAVVVIPLWILSRIFARS